MSVKDEGSHTGGLADGCPTLVSECSPRSGAIYQLWANGLGPVSQALEDGVPAPPAALSTQAGCQLTIGGQPATVLYCGAAPGAFTTASLSVGGATGNFSSGRAGELIATR